VCCGPAPTGFTHCFACRHVVRSLGLTLSPALPARLCPIPSTLYSVLVAYKEAALGEARRRDGTVVCALLGEHMATQRDRVAGRLDGLPDHVVPVPSTSRPDGSPLGRVDGLPAAAVAPFPSASWSPALLRRAAAPVGHMRPSPQAFAVPEPRAVIGSRVVLIDDTYVSGARAQSAAAALRLAGARSVVIVAAGRVLRPDRVRAHAAFMAHAAALAEKHADGAARARCAQTVASTE